MFRKRPPIARAAASAAIPGSRLRAVHTDVFPAGEAGSRGIFASGANAGFFGVSQGANGCRGGAESSRQDSRIHLIEGAQTSAFFLEAQRAVLLQGIADLG